ncbi:MAG: AAA family ATPase [Desulfovibrio sp.]|nr:AAA family ATPase [Desulfovibrio sp.]
MDFTPLAGRRVFFWPDADAPGAKAALASRSLLEKAGAESVAVAVPPEDAPQGWDAADAVGPDGWDRQQAQAFIRDASTTPAVFAKVAAQRWEVTPQEKVDTTAAAPAASPLRVVNVAEFLTLDLPEREMLLAPILPKQGLVMLHAARGIGKTYMGLSMAYAVASGGGIFGRWQALAPARVLYLDGEMPARTLQARIESIIEGNEEQPPAPDFLRFLTPDLQGGPMPNLATEAGQAALAPFLEGVELVVLDNLATLARHGRANDEESWTPVQGWLLELRRRGISVLLVHHQGKGGDQRGTSAKEDILDTVIRLDRPRDYQSEQGAVFEVRLTKARGIFGDDAKPFEAQLRDSGQGLTWLTRDIEEADLERLRRLLADGYSIRDAAEEMGKSKSAVDRLKRKLEAS